MNDCFFCGSCIDDAPAGHDGWVFGFYDEPGTTYHSDLVCPACVASRAAHVTDDGTPWMPMTDATDAGGSPRP